MLRNDFDRTRTVIHRCSLLTTGLVAVVAACSTTASASLIGSTYSLRLEGHVKIGAQTSIEGYAATPVFNSAASDLPNTIVPTPDPPFDPGESLRVSEGEAGDHVAVWVRGHDGGPETFANPLDPNQLVELEVAFTLPGLAPDEMMVVSNVEIENFGLFYDPVSTQVSGVGTALNPLRILALLDPDDVHDGSTSHVKLHFDYDTGKIPEPATLALVGIGLAGMVGCRRRRS